MASAPIKSVLVVDDSRLARLMISKFIANRHPHWLILEAGSGPEAIEKAKVESPNYITMDYNMEGMNGAEAARQILEYAPKTNIVLFTANIQSSTRAEAGQLGLHFVAKPVTEQSVRHALEFFESRA